jgi:hypothetical protein
VLLLLLRKTFLRVFYRYIRTRKYIHIFESLNLLNFHYLKDKLFSNKLDQGPMLWFKNIFTKKIGEKIGALDLIQS